ncbi:YcjF family protein [Yoonia sp.]|uniref:YcjF family protein n=1 Tax=Yoonia sp. TaxID=2212373 RepID=UPI0039756D66
MTRGPVLIDLEGTDAAQPATAPAVEDDRDIPRGVAMQQVAAITTRRPSRLARWFWSVTLALVGFIASLAAWDYVTGLLSRSPVLGGIATALIGLLLLVLLIIGLRELAAFGRLRTLDSIQHKAAGALISLDLKQARIVLGDLEELYGNREDTAWGRAELKSRQGDILDADGLLGLAETSLLAPLDARAQREVEAAARQVATVTAIVPLALADLFTALTANLRMIRRIAEIYGGRSGTLGSWRLTRTVLTHLVATGAVAVGDDLIGSVAGGGVLSKVSRRFGEGVINGALTARVGVAAIEVCRPLPFHATKKPSVSSLVGRAMSGLFNRG